jgi:hypothetical protein
VAKQAEEVAKQTAVAKQAVEAVEEAAEAAKQAVEKAAAEAAAKQAVEEEAKAVAFTNPEKDSPVSQYTGLPWKENKCTLGNGGKKS